MAAAARDPRPYVKPPDNRAMAKANGKNSGESRRARQLWLVPSEGDTHHQLVAEVAVNAPAMTLYSYRVPDDLRDELRPGNIVTVPYGRGSRTIEGFCARVTRQPWDQTRKPILAVESGLPWLSESLIELALWVSDYYACSPWKTFAAILPATLRKPHLKRVTYVHRTEVEADRLTPRQKALLAAVGEEVVRKDVALHAAGVSAASLRTLCQRGLLECVVRQEPVPPDESVWTSHAAQCAEDTFELTPGQQAAYEPIRENLESGPSFGVFVLFGVPGSGKTEVYVRSMRAAVQAGRQVILLIPEIALATQVIDRLARRFDRVAVLHSQLPARRRHDTLAAIAAGDISVIIGTRTAVFAPCPRLGMIVVDEEQEGSFKNLAQPYYHARDVAIKRGQLDNIPVVLGSATPSLETWHNAQHRSHYQLLQLPDRVPGARLPEVQLVAHRRDTPDQPTGLLSGGLYEQLEETLADGQQAILLHNRRGFAAYLKCSQCGLMVCCDRCGTHLIYHQSDRVMKCHRCGARSPVPPRCVDDTCGGALERSGSAIQQLEQELHRLLPTARLLRLDSDTMRRREDYRVALQSFEVGEADILLGTQMVAKGLDFPRVRLVGVIDADAALSLPDFRAAERVFQLVVQVVGRAGRREGHSLALVQTARRPAPVIAHALRMDYESFAQGEVPLRARYFYPPVARMARLICADERPGRAREEAERLAKVLRERAERIHARLRVDPPGPCVIPRLREMLRHEIILRGPHGTSIQQLLRQASQDRLLTPRVRRFTVDVDPIDLL